MRSIGLAAFAAALCVTVTAAHAQPVTATSPPPAGATAPGMGSGMGPRGMDGSHGMAGGMRARPGATMGWSLMTPEERREHQTKMMSFTTAKECRAFVEAHHRLMVDRARKRGVAAPATPRRDPCDGLK